MTSPDSAVASTVLTDERVDELLREFGDYSADLPLGRVFGTPTIGELLSMLAEVQQARRSAPVRDEWRPIKGVPRDQLPGTLIVWIVGGTEHSDVQWRREGSAIVTLNNDGPFGFEADGLKAARKRLDMQWIDEIEFYRPAPAPPAIACALKSAPATEQ